MTTSASSAAFGLRPVVYLSGFGCACAVGGLGGPEGVEEGGGCDGCQRNHSVRDQVTGT